MSGYEFEFVLSPLSAGGVGMFISDQFNYKIIEKTSTKAFQALWIDFRFEKKSNIICGLISTGSITLQRAFRHILMKP